MSFARLQHDAIAVLTEWSAPDAAQDELRRQYLRHLGRNANAVARDGVPDHITCGGFVFDPSLEHVALVFHSKARLWLQPGGHCEDTDDGLIEAGLREISEETGLPIGAEHARVVDLHHHELSAAFGRCRSHLDVRIAVVLDRPAQIVCSDESEDAAWWPVDALPSPTDPDLPETISRVRTLLMADRDRPGRPAARPSVSAAGPSRS